MINQSYSQRDCDHEHAALSQVNSTKTGLYPQSMCNLICKGIKTFFEGSSSQHVSDLVVYRQGIPEALVCIPSDAMSQSPTSDSSWELVENDEVTWEPKERKQVPSSCKDRLDSVGDPTK